jgi:hypothetical protein
MIGYVVGSLLAPLVSGFARFVGLDRDGAFYPTVLIVVASYYVLFAAMGGSMRALVMETMVMGGFVVWAVAGLRYGTWVVVAGLAAHGLFDVTHAQFIDNSGVPAWWPAFCLTYDVGAAASLAWLASSRPARGSAP